MSSKTRLVLLSISLAGLVALGVAGTILFQWVIDGRFGDEAFVGNRFVILGLGVAAIASSAPVAAVAQNWSRRRRLPPEDIAGQIIGFWLLSNLILAAIGYFALPSGGVMGERLLIVWFFFAVGGIPGGLRQASRRWAFAERVREADEQIERMREESALQTKEHEAKMEAIRAKHAQTMKRLKEQTRPSVSSPWYKAYTGRW